MDIKNGFVFLTELEEAEAQVQSPLEISAESIKTLGRMIIEGREEAEHLIADHDTLAGNVCFQLAAMYKVDAFRTILFHELRKELRIKRFSEDLSNITPEDIIGPRQ